MSDDDYTPSDVRVRQVWQEFAEMKGSKRYPDEVFAQFDRWLAAHDAALLEAQSTELALYKTRARLQVLVVELNADLDRTEAERDAARATIAEAHDVWAGSWQFGLGFDDRLVLDRILSRGVREATEPIEP